MLDLLRVSHAYRHFSIHRSSTHAQFPHGSLRSAVVEGSSSLPKRPELDTQQDESSDEEEVEITSIQSFDVALTLAKDLL